MSASEIYKEGARVWIPHPQRIWVGGRLKTSYQENCGLDTLLIKYDESEVVEGDDYLWHLKRRLSDGKNMQSQKVSDDKGLHFPPLRNPEILIGQNDLTSLSYLNEPEVLYNLQVRFCDRKEIYTRCGIVLVAINPYEYLPIYGNDMIQEYHGQDVHNMDPHIFGVAEEAYSRMVNFEEDQSIIVSGESGAGKTVSAKYTMRYFATVGGAENETQVEKRVLASNPLTEAIGNAKTTRNDNSSRFGKYIELKFGGRKNRIMGANMKTYLLEKSRVVFQSAGERNYHVFYQLCSSRSNSDFSSLHLLTAEEFHYTNQGACTEIDGVDDEKEMFSTKEAMTQLGINESEQADVFRVLGGILHLGNVQFQEEERGDASMISPNQESFHYMCTLLGCEEKDNMRLWLCNRNIQTVHEHVKKPLTLGEASYARDALAKHIYSRLFDWLVQRINESLLSGGVSTGRSQVKQQKASISRFIGVLDIYGFETFLFNSFEQFCINYANEKLQQQFNLHVFKLEQEEYVKEGIEWSFIQFYDNQLCIDLIEKKLGILDLLDEECRMPKASDLNWCQKLYQHHSRAEHFEKPKMSHSSFIVKHFADSVTYQAEGFLEKNRDTVLEEQLILLKRSQVKFISDLFQSEEDGVSELGTNSASISATNIRGNIKVNVAKRTPSTVKRQMKKTVGYQFRESLQQLMGILSSTTPHYVRCIKPNDLKLSFTFSPARAVQQLRACGVLETVRLSAAGYPSRWTYTEFFTRYRVLVHSRLISRRDIRLSCSRIVENIIQDKTKYHFGKTKLFFRAGQVAYLEQLRSEKFHSSSVIIQTHMRGWFTRMRYKRIRTWILFLQSQARAFLARQKAESLRQNRAAIKIQSWYRQIVLHRHYLLMKQSAIKIQIFYRAYKQKQLRVHMRVERFTVLCQSVVRGWLDKRRYQKFRRAVIALQCHFRRRLAVKEFKALKTEARSIEHVKSINYGLEMKIIELKQNLDSRENQLHSLLGDQERLNRLQIELVHVQQSEAAARSQLGRLAELETEVAYLRAQLIKEREETQRIQKLREEEVQDQLKIVNMLREEKFDLLHKLEDYERKSGEKDAEIRRLRSDNDRRRVTESEDIASRSQYEQLLQQHDDLQREYQTLSMKYTDMRQAMKRQRSALPGTVREEDDEDEDVGNDYSKNYSVTQGDTRRVVSAVSLDSNSLSGEESESFKDDSEEHPKNEWIKNLPKSIIKYLQSLQMPYRSGGQNTVDSDDENLIVLLLRAQHRNGYLETELHRLYSRMESLQREVALHKESLSASRVPIVNTNSRNSSPSKNSSADKSTPNNAISAEDCYFYVIRSGELEKENVLLRKQLDELMGNKHGKNKGAKDLLAQLKALHDEMVNRREECIELRSSLAMKNKSLPLSHSLSEPRGDDENEEFAEAFQSQKVVNRKLQSEIDRLIVINKDIQESYQKDVKALKEEINRQQTMISQLGNVLGNLDVGPLQRLDACVMNDCMRLTSENLNLNEKLEQFLLYKIRLQTALRFFAHSAIRGNSSLSSKFKDMNVNDLTIEYLLEISGAGMESVKEPVYKPISKSQTSSVPTPPIQDQAMLDEDSYDDRTSAIFSKQSNYSMLRYPPAAKDTRPRALLSFTEADIPEILRILVDKMEPKVAMALKPPNLPSYLFIMAMRYTDFIQKMELCDQFVCSLLERIRSVIQDKQRIPAYLCLWLSNLLTMLNCLKQYSGDEIYQRENTPMQNYHSFKNMKMDMVRDSFREFIIRVYRTLIRNVCGVYFSKPVIVAAIVDHNGLSTVSAVIKSQDPTSVTISPGNMSSSSQRMNLHKFLPPSFGKPLTTSNGNVLTRINPSAELDSYEKLIRLLSNLHHQCVSFNMDPDVINQLFYELFYHITAHSINRLLTRMDDCNISKAIAINYNITQLGTWIRDYKLQSSNAEVWLLPMKEAIQLLQTSKTSSDVDSICDMCSHLNIQQVKKLLQQFSPTDGYGERTPPEVIEAVEKRLTIMRGENIKKFQERENASSLPQPDTLAYSKDLMFHVDASFPLHIPYRSTKVAFESITLPSSLSLDFLKIV